MPYFSSFFHCIVFSVTVKKKRIKTGSLWASVSNPPPLFIFSGYPHRLQQQFFLPKDQPCTCEHNRVTQDPVRENQIADDTCSNQKNGARQKKSWIHQIFLDSFVHQNPFAHHLVSNRIQNIACQRRVTGCNITENTDKNKVQHYVGYRCRPCLNRKRAVFWSNVHERTPCFQIICEFLTIQSHAKWKKNCESWLHEWAIFVEFHIARSNIEMQRKRNQDGVLNRYVYFMIPALT